jgi:hypothetical protein
MPLFECEKCHCVENTALCHYWSRFYNDRTGEALCSECDPSIKKWHGRFPKRNINETRYKLNNRGFLE